VWNKHFRRNLLPSRDELTRQSLKTDLVDHLRLRAPEAKAAGRYSVLQKISYFIVIFIVSPFMILSGLAQMPAFTAISPELIDLFGGRQTARTLHVIGMLWMILFVLVHVFEVFVAGVVNEVRSMITGKYAVQGEDTG
jgi:thiosulfate reductase cytochrome b subunit